MNHATTGLSVVIPYYGLPDETLNLVRSLLDEDESGSIIAKIVVSDDASPHPYPAQAYQDSRLTVMRREVNGGFGAAVNTGLRAVETPLALILNSDVHITCTQISQLVRLAAPHQPVVASPQITYPDGTPQWAGRRDPTIFQYVIEWLHPLVRLRRLSIMHRAVGHDVRAAQARDITPVDWVSGAAMLIPTEAVSNIGGFDEAFFMYCEEVDLQRRLRAEGVTAVIIPQVRVAHTLGASSESSKRRQWLTTSRHIYATKWGHPAALTIALYAASAANLLWNAGRQICGRNIDALAVYRAEKQWIKQSGAGEY